MCEFYKYLCKMVRRYSKKRNFRRRYRRRGDNLKKVRKTIRKMKNDIETKTYIRYYTIKPAPGPVAYAGSFVQPIANENVDDPGEQGTQSNQMIGRKYKAVGVKLNYNLVKQTSGSVGQFRILVCWFNQTPPGFAAPDFTKYFNNVDDGGTQIPAYLATQNSSTTSKMKILYDKRVDFGIKNATVPYAAGRQSYSGSIYIRLNRDVVFEGRDSTGWHKGRLVYWLINAYSEEVEMNFLSKFYYRDP